MGLDISPMCDRKNPTTEKSQVHTFSFAFHRILETKVSVTDNLM